MNPEKIPLCFAFANHLPVAEGALENLGGGAL